MMEVESSPFFSPQKWLLGGIFFIMERNDWMREVEGKNEEKRKKREKKIKKTKEECG